MMDFLFMLPLWLLAGLGDWLCHRRARIERTSGAPESGMHVVLTRAAGSSLDCGALWKQLAARVGGRGGGRADRAEGRLTARVDDWPALVGELLG